MTNPFINCPVCGTVIPADAPAGACPACALRGGFGTDHGGDAVRAPQAADLESLRALFPNFDLLNPLGGGGMGEVYRARQKNLNRLVAIKLLPPSFRGNSAFIERFQREAQTLARLNHPNIVTIFEFGETDGRCYLVMELVDGMNLRQLLSLGKMEPREALALIPGLCEALQFAHEHGVVHRDIKPENILIDRQGRVKVVDFGIAKIMDGAPGGKGLTAFGEKVGTPDYMAPEQRDRPAAVDHRADIFSLGVVLYEMLTGEVPRGRFEPPSQRVQVDVRLDAIVLRAMAANPDLRYQKVGEFKTGVATVAGSPAPVGKPPLPLLSPSGRRELVAAAVLLLVLIAWFEVGRAGLVAPTVEKTLVAVPPVAVPSAIVPATPVTTPAPAKTADPQAASIAQAQKVLGVIANLQANRREFLSLHRTLEKDLSALKDAANAVAADGAAGNAVRIEALRTAMDDAIKQARAIGERPEDKARAIGKDIAFQLQALQ